MVTSPHQPLDVIDIESRETQQPSWLDGRHVCVVSGIASPESFERTVESLGARIALAVRFTDHHAFTVDELKAVERQAAREKCGTVVITEKDNARLPADFQGALPWRTLRIGIAVRNGQEFVERIIRSVYRINA